MMPANLEDLRQAKFDLMAAMRVDLDESAVLVMFHEDECAGWLKRKLAEVRGPVALSSSGGAAPVHARTGEPHAGSRHLRSLGAGVLPFEASARRR
jgi:hypothetical protein